MKSKTRICEAAPTSELMRFVRPTDDERPFLLSIYDYSGNWSWPYFQAGWNVLLWDKQFEGDILEGFTSLQIMIEEKTGGKIDGLLAAPPCTAFAGSGARWWPDKDAKDERYFPFDSFTGYMKGLTLIVFHIIDLFEPDFWALENPVGRIERIVPELKKYRKMTFQPNEFGDPYTKRTILYGQFNANLPQNYVEPTEGSKMHKLPPSKNRARIRSKTPAGFSEAFYQANNEYTKFRKQLAMKLV